MRKFRNLIIVPGHAIYTGTNSSHADSDEFWIGEFSGEGKYYAEHADRGVREADEIKNVALIFSGGQTRKKAGPLSEAQSYWFLENQRNWLGTDVSERATTEEYARDSFENLDFSIRRFRQCTGLYPVKILVCGWAFKECRYKLHVSAMGWDARRFLYVSVNNPSGDPNDPNSPIGKALAGEKMAIKLFTRYPYGNAGELLKKRLSRDPFNRGNPYY